MHRWIKRNFIFKDLCVPSIPVFRVLYNLFLYSQVHPTTSGDAYTIPEGKFEKKLFFFYSTCLFRHLDLSLSLFRLCSQIAGKNSMTVSLLCKWTRTSASAGWNTSLVHPAFWPTRSVDCLQIVARKIHTRSFCSSSLLQWS